MLIAFACARPVVAAGFIETFETDPVAAGRFQLHDGDAARFIYVPGEPSLLARYNTLMPTARLIRPLCRPLTERDSFTCSVRFRIHSAGFSADPRRHAQIAFGFMNRATTGSDRVYGRDGLGAFDLVSFDYYPNVSLFGGPSAGPTLISANAGGGFSAAIDFGFGPETEMNDAGESPLPLDTPLTATIRYDATARRATLRIAAGDDALSINTVGQDYETGGLDGDSATIQTDLTGAGFTVDSFALLLWQDTSASFATVVADVSFERVEVEARPWPDFDGDGDVDRHDLGLFRACQGGPSLPIEREACRKMDLDCDHDVDQEDFGLFQAEMTPPK